MPLVGVARVRERHDVCEDEYHVVPLLVHDVHLRDGEERLGEGGVGALVAVVRGLHQEEDYIWEQLEGRDVSYTIQGVWSP